MFPVSKDIFDLAVEKTGIIDLGTATIRQICSLSEAVEEMAGEKMVHLEIGNPGLAAEAIGIEAEIQALREGVANKYPPIQGLPVLKKSAHRFIEAFLDIDIPERCIVPTVGSMQGSFTIQLLLGQRLPEKDTMLFVCPGFPAQVNQAKLLGLKTEKFDIYQYRGRKLEQKLEELLSKGNITALIYSNPNNPAWTNLTEEELEIIGRLATKYDCIVVEDIAYFGMDFRRDISTPYEPPYGSTVAKYTDNYIILLSASKIFSYAGQRISLVCMSPQVFDRKYDVCRDFYEMPNFGDSYIYGVLYCSSSGTAHSAQRALAAMMDAAVDGRLNFVKECSEYGRRAVIVKKLFEDNGFHIVYDRDGDEPIADGFFFTIGYPGMTSRELQQELIRYGVSSIGLTSTGSDQDGIRVCVSMISHDDDFERLSKYLAQFHKDHKVKTQKPEKVELY